MNTENLQINYQIHRSSESIKTEVKVLQTFEKTMHTIRIFEAYEIIGLINLINLINSTYKHFFRLNVATSIITPTFSSQSLTMAQINYA